MKLSSPSSFNSASDDKSNPTTTASAMVTPLATPIKTPTTFNNHLPISGSTTKVRPTIIQSLSAKRARQQVPGTIDLSTLPQFPQINCHNLTPQDSSSTTADTSGSTPRAMNDQSGLFSRWSTDSEDSDDDDEDHDNDSSCTSYDGEDSFLDSAGHGCVTSESADDADGENSPRKANNNEMRKSRSKQLSKKSSASPSPSSSMLLPRAQSRSRSRSPNNHNNIDPFIINVSDYAEAFSSPLSSVAMPSSSPMGALDSLLPPAPKPHQQGFSPYTEEQSYTFELSSPRLGSGSAASRRRQQQTRRSPSASSSSRRRDGIAGSESESSSSGSDSDTENLFAVPTKRLTRSQGLRIRDQGGDRPAGRYARALSQQLKHSLSAPSSPMKTANALLDGTISPAESTTDPLRVKLRELPGAKTPDGSAPSSPSLSPSIHQQSRKRSSHKHLNVTQTRNSPRLRASSPLHLSSLPEEGETSASASSNTTDTKSNIFNSAFSFANRESPNISPLALRSPRTQMPPIKEITEKDSNPYFAGYA